MGFRSADIDHLAHRVAADGPDAHSVDVAGFVATARAAGVAPVVLDVLSDPALPTVVRQRAFGQAASALGRHQRRHRRDLPLAS